MSSTNISTADKGESGSTKKRKKFKHHRREWTAVLAKLAVSLLSYLPYHIALLFGKFVGSLLFYVSGSERRLCLDNLRHAISDTHSQAEIKRIAKQCFQNYGMTFLQNLVIQRWGVEKAMRLLTIKGFDEFRSRVDQLLEEGKGVLFLTGHFGNYEFFAAAGTTIYGSRQSVVAKRYDLEAYNQIVESIRTKLGINIIYQDEGIWSIARPLRENGLIGMLPDQDAKKVGGVFADFFGRSAYTPSGPALLSRRLSCPIQLGYMLRSSLNCFGPSSKEFQVVVCDAIHPQDYAKHEDPVQALTEAWSQSFENEVRKALPQWSWTHKRWHTTPAILERRKLNKRSALGEDSTA